MVFSDETVYYIDPATITQEKISAGYGRSFDLSARGPDGERSILASVEYDCAETA